MEHFIQINFVVHGKLYLIQLGGSWKVLSNSVMWFMESLSNSVKWFIGSY